MKHPAYGQLYCFRYLHPARGDSSWNSWRIRRLETAMSDIQTSLDDFKEAFPTIKGRMLWWNENDPAGAGWQEIKWPNPKSKYALFSED